MNRRNFLKTLSAGSMMIMLPSLSEAVASNSSLQTAKDLAEWMEARYECHVGEARAFMCLKEDQLKKYNLSMDDIPIENKVWDAVKNIPEAANLAYVTVAFAVEGNNLAVAERQLVNALKEKFEQEIPPQTLIWRLKPEFTSDQMVEYGETYATREQIEDKLIDVFSLPHNVEHDFETDSFKYVQRKYVLNKLRMRLVFPKQIAEDYDELTIANGDHPKRI